MYGSNRELNQRTQLWTDSLGKQIADGTTNDIDIASHYDFSPERSRVFYNDSRRFIQYGDDSNFTDNPGTWSLSPDAGDSMRFESAESCTYVVNYELMASWAFQVNQSLQDGDVVKAGAYAADNGWFMEQRGSDHADDEVDLKVLDGGTEHTLAEDVELPKSLTGWRRYAMMFNWYGAGQQKWIQTYTDDGDQFNPLVAETSRDGVQVTENANVNVRYEVTAGPSTSNLSLEIGSLGLVVNGDVTTLARDKPQLVEIPAATIDTNDVWIPVYAVRIDPNQDTVNVSFTDLQILEYSGANGLVELVVTSVSPSNTDASGFSVPEYHHAQNSVLQDTQSITEAPNDSGTQEDLSSTGSKFGGFTLASAAISSGGNTQSTTATVNQSREQKKHVLASDELVFLVRTDASGGTLRFVWDADQDY